MKVELKKPVKTEDALQIVNAYGNEGCTNVNCDGATCTNNCDCTNYCSDDVNGGCIAF